MTCASSADGRIHICWGSGRYLGQVRGIGCRRWRTVTGKCSRAETALAAAVKKMGRDDKRARALFVPNSSHRNPDYYGPSLAMEASRT